MRIVASQAVAHRRRMYSSLDVAGLLFRVTRQTKCRRRRGGQLHARYILIDAHLMTAQTPRPHCGVDRLSLRLVLVALQALLRIHVFIQRNGVHRRVRTRRKNSKEKEPACGYQAFMDSRHGAGFVISSVHGDPFLPGAGVQSTTRSCRQDCAWCRGTSACSYLSPGYTLSAE